MTAARPFAYLRKSRILRDKAVISPEMQLAQVTTLAAGYGDHDLTILSDMNVSGRKGRARRPGFGALLDGIDAGQVSAVYSYSLSRLSRSTRDILSLAESCKVAKVPIRLAADQDPDPTTASGRMVLTMLAGMATYEADVASERSLDIIETRRARGDRLGPPLYDDPDAVVAAYRTAGSYNGAARLLTAQGTASMNGRAWRPTTVRQIVLRAAPEAAPRHPHRGSKGSAPFVLYRLLRCHCGATLTGTRRPSGVADYRCTAGRTDPAHSRPVSIAEARVLPWVEAEAARWERPEAVEIEAALDETKRADLDGQRARIVDSYVSGAIDQADRNRRLAGVDAAIDALGTRSRIVELRDIDIWMAPVRNQNDLLRALFDYIELGPDLLPIRAEWTAPEWRRS